MLPVFLKQAGSPLSQGEGPAEAVPALPHPDLAAFAGVDARTEVARRKDGPFAPLPIALAEDATLRETFARGLELPLVETYAKVRFWLLIGLVPLLMLAELDRELWNAHYAGAGARMMSDLFIVAIAGADLVRRLPRHPITTAVLLFGGAARYLLFVARPCGSGVHPTIFVAPVVAVAAAVLVVRHAPRPARVAEAILARLGISAEDAALVRRDRAPTRQHVAAATLAAMGLPLSLALSHALGVWAQAAIFVAYAAAAPLVVARLFERGAPWPRVAWSRILPAALVAFALTVGMTNGAHYGLDAGAYATRCVSPGAFESSAKRVLDAESRDLAKNVLKARESWAYFGMTVFIVPLAEERVFRGLLQRLLARRFGEARGIFFASIAFGIAHLGVYKIAVYQTVLLGISFGTAYATGGYAAAVLTHSAWNLHLVL